jgi:hypothetical protein
MERVGAVLVREQRVQRLEQRGLAPRRQIDVLRHPHEIARLALRIRELVGKVVGQLRPAREVAVGAPVRGRGPPAEVRAGAQEGDDLAFLHPPGDDAAVPLDGVVLWRRGTPTISDLAGD